MIVNNNLTSLNEMMQFNLQDSGCFLMEQLTMFHDHSLFFLLFILSLVFYIIISLFIMKSINLFLLFNEWAELVWTMLPGLILSFIALPSLKVLYLTDEILDPDLTIKAIGHQWNWSYEYSDFYNIEFNSFMSMENNSNFRLLDVDNRVVIPLKISIRMIVSSTDVIHSWTVPSLGVKMDANPGRLNQLILQSNRAGLFYGQCSEICGSLHSFMPICVEVTDLDTFSLWISTM